MNLAALLANRVIRWIAGVAFAGVCLWAARCSGAVTQRAADAMDAADVAAARSQHVTDSLNAIRSAEGKRFADSLAALDRVARIAQASARRADSVAGRLAVVGTIRIVRAPRPDSASAPRPGLGAADEPPDTTAYATIQRQGDSRLYPVPQFSVDAFTAQRRALADAQAAEVATGARLADAQRLLAIDTVTIRQQAKTIADRTQGEDAAKSRAGRECSILLFLPCPPRKIVAIAGLAAGVVGGMAIEQHLSTHR